MVKVKCIKQHRLLICVFDLKERVGPVASPRGGMGGPDPPTSVQTSPEICANPLRSILYIGGGGVPCMYIVTFYCSPAKKNCSDPPTFFGLATPLSRAKV